MDQIYIPKRRFGFAIGTYVVLKPLEEEKIIGKPIFYNIKYLEPIKLRIIEEIFKIIERLIKYDNIIITGSFLEDGFRFNDIDIVIVGEEKIDIKYIERILNNAIGANFHIISIDNKSLIEGLSTDPLYEAILSKCAARKRFVYKIKPKINYKLLDLHLLKSKPLMENFDFLTGDEKYEMTRNLIAINQFIDGKKITKENIDLAIDDIFGKDIVQKLKNNMLSKKDFLARYRKIYNDTQNRIFEGVEDESK